MKIFKNFIFGLCVAAGKDPRMSYCDVDELSLPANAERWDCAGTTDQYVPTGARCYLQCNPGFIPTSCNLKALVFNIK